MLYSPRAQLTTLPRASPNNATVHQACQVSRFDLSNFSFQLMSSVYEGHSSGPKMVGLSITVERAYFLLRKASGDHHYSRYFYISILQMGVCSVILA